ncbi:protein of unknown function [Micromonospora pattaloongensis]|uniref:DUF4192 domain-containing protein n=1 Tax=Micromonospora pattaloongensis TaxID=405436 RepID=A0A1H3HQV1_9ACTN|nr:DUF4192 domain-containing protein [Micromonospora pattaloongensis]SDY17853.1 protein of unknown function [Micromonospora pattaloongensis]
MTSTEPTRLSVRSIADLIAAVPYLLGFHPADSVVVVAMRGKKITFVARGDVPDPAGGGPTPDAAAAHVAAVVARQEAQSATVLGYGPPQRVTAVVAAVGAALRERGVRVLDSLRVTDGRYWSYTCDNPDCCPPEGTPFDPAASQVAAAATVAGHVALPGRDALTRQVAPVDGLAAESMRQATTRADERLGMLLERAPSADLLGGRALREAGAAAVREAMERHRERGRLTDDETAWLTVLLLHLPVRDHAWERIGDDDWHVELWTEVARRAQPDLVAAPASLLAFAAWRAGQGALAGVAVERALGCDPGYSMALLMADVLRQGVPPATLDGWPEVSPAPPDRRRAPGSRGRRRRARA